MGHVRPTTFSPLNSAATVRCGPAGLMRELDTPAPGSTPGGGLWPDYARSWGRFTRNFVVQGTAAEWALTWIAGVRQRLWDARLGPLEHQPHLVMFVHDELVVHCPTEYVATATAAMHDAAAEAARVVFGGTDVTFPVTVAAVDRYSDAK